MALGRDEDRFGNGATGYRPDIDGLRALAIIPVLLFHAELGAPGGFVGVDIFFVISGYLIASLIARDLEAGTFRFTEFWSRRVRRILPALSVVVLVSLVLGGMFLIPADFTELGASAVAQSAFAPNIYFWHTIDYFARPAEVKPLLHLWSLGVEEQFYILLPLGLWGLWRLGRRRAVAVVAVVAIASLALSAYGTARWPLATFYLLPARAWELLLGVLLALLPRGQGIRPVLRECLGMAGLAAILVTVLVFDRYTPFPGVNALLPCGGAAALIFANGRGPTLAGRLLARPPVVFVGLISYSLYLWHWPLLVFVKYVSLDPLGPGVAAIVLIATVVLATGSWKFVETPFRQGGFLRANGRAFAFAGAVMVAIGVGGLSISRAGGFPFRLSEAARRYAAGVDDRAFLHELTLENARDQAFVELGGASKDRPVDILLWGDSHAMAIAPAIDDLCRVHGMRGLAATRSSTVPVVWPDSGLRNSPGEDAPALARAVVDFAIKNRVRQVLIAAEWNRYWNYGEPLARTVAELEGSGARVWIMKQVPTQRWHVPQALVRTLLAGGDPARLGLPAMEWPPAARMQEEQFRALAPHAAILDPAEKLVRRIDSREFFPVEANGAALYRDTSHLTVQGALGLKSLFAPLFPPQPGSP